jgi:hypothetical protein
MKYTYSDDEDDIYSDSTTRRSTRNTGTHTPTEPAGPTVTLSGRQVRSRIGGAYGESMLSGTHPVAATNDETEQSVESLDKDDSSVGPRPRRAAGSNRNGTKSSRAGRHIEGYNSVDDMDSEEDASEQDYGDDEEDDDVVSLADDEDAQDSVEDDLEMDDDDEDATGKKSLVVTLPLKTPTPEKKPPFKFKFSPQKKSPEPTAASTTKSEATTAPESSGPNTEPLTNVTQPANSSPRTVDDTGTNNANVRPAPLSPSLTFRGSPEKNHALPQAIHVGQGSP